MRSENGGGLRDTHVSVETEAFSQAVQYSWHWCLLTTRDRVNLPQNTKRLVSEWSQSPWIKKHRGVAREYYVYPTIGRYHFLNTSTLWFGGCKTGQEIFLVLFSGQRSSSCVSNCMSDCHHRATALREPWPPVLFASTGLYPELSFSILQSPISRRSSWTSSSHLTFGLSLFLLV
jgi:hypothetical protein